MKKGKKSINEALDLINFVIYFFILVGHVFHFDFKYEMIHLNIIRMFDFLDLRKAFDAVYSGKIKVLYKWNVL